MIYDNGIRISGTVSYNTQSEYDPVESFYEDQKLVSNKKEVDSLKEFEQYKLAFNKEMELSYKPYFLEKLLSKIGLFKQ